MRRIAALLALIAATGAASADGLQTSLRPVARPAHLQPEVAPARLLYEPLRPVARPENAQNAEALSRASMPYPIPIAPVQPGVALDFSLPLIEQNPERAGLMALLRPPLRPSGIGRNTQEREQTLTRGALCGDAAIQGEEVGVVPGKLDECGIEDAVKVRSISGVALSQHALMDCRTARTIKAWMRQGMAPAISGYGGGVAQLRVAAHYSCRTRNNQVGGKVSEHGKGHAIDIAGFQLRDGRTISVLDDWGGGKKGRILSRMHRSACGPFATVLGPESDRFHRDHFHFDTASRNSGSYCR
ncbi:MAG: extensin family protein [Rhodobacterales bacterium]|nr:extensin family protein [Rhodobacterales bacterium]